jgi:hypothetical protein
MTAGSGIILNNEAPPPFLPLEESQNPSHFEQDNLLAYSNHNSTNSKNSDDNKGHPKKRSARDDQSSKMKRAVGAFFALLVLFLLYDAIFTPPERRFIKPDASDRFLRWVQRHPVRGIVAFMLVFAVAVILLLPVGTPLTIGCGFVYKGAYGWKLGVVIATIVSMAGSAAGAVSCFLLGRYLLRDHVRTWIVKYPLFVAIDIGEYKRLSRRSEWWHMHVRGLDKGAHTALFLLDEYSYIIMNIVRRTNCF